MSTEKGSSTPRCTGNSSAGPLSCGARRRPARGPSVMLSLVTEDAVEAPPTTASVPRSDLVPLREATRAWFAISLQTFGGPAGQIAVMQRALVDDKRWIGQQRFLPPREYFILLPRPGGPQPAPHRGGGLHGARGGGGAGGGFVLPGPVALAPLPPG